METLILGDCREVLRGLDTASVDACCTDPPYELSFMGKQWDRTGIAYDVLMWREVLRVLKPGGHLLAFGGTRTQHRMVCAIEDAGFEVRDCLYFCHGSGFPKNAKVSLKPAVEPICLARKPLEKGLTVAQNVVKWGTEALNIDGCRVGTGENLGRYAANPQGREDGWGMATRQKGDAEYAVPAARFPANLLHDGSEEVVAAFPANAPSGGGVKCPKGTAYSFMPGEDAKGSSYDNPGVGGDSGSAARFFQACPPDDEELLALDRIIYRAKPAKSEKEKGCKGLAAGARPLGISQWEGQTNGSGERMGPSAPSRNHHPTVKGLSLMRYLVRLVTPPSGTVLDPFLGSGTTAVACVAEGFDCVGIELEPGYMEIAKARIGAEARTLCV